MTKSKAWHAARDASHKQTINAATPDQQAASFFSPLSLRSVGALSIFTAISRIMGQMRATLWAALLATSPLADAFYLAIKLPSLMRAYFAEGVMSAALVPTYTGKLKNKQAEETSGNAAALLRAVLFLLVPSLMVVVGLVLLLAPFLADFYFSLTSLEGETTLVRNVSQQLIRIAFPYLVFISLASFFASIMQSHRRFGLIGIIPLLFNFVNISVAMAILFFRDAIDQLSAAQYLTWGFVGAGAVQMLFSLYFFRRWQQTDDAPRLHLEKTFAIKNIFSLKVWKQQLRNSSMQTFFKRLSPTAFSSLVNHVNIVLLDPIALSLGGGTLAVLFYSNRIAELPLGLLSYPLAVVALPKLAILASEKDHEKIRHTVTYAFSLLLLFLVPIVVVAISYRELIVDLLFGYGSFSQQAIKQTASTLGFHLIALPALGLYRILTSLFFASGNTVAPLRAALLAVGVSLAFAFSLTRFFPHPAAISFSSAIASYAMLIFLFVQSRVQLKQPLFVFALHKVLWYLLALIFPYVSARLFTKLAMLVADSVRIAFESVSQLRFLVLEKSLLLFELCLFSGLFFVFYFLVLRFMRDEVLENLILSLPETMAKPKR